MKTYMNLQLLWELLKTCNGTSSQKQSQLHGDLIIKIISEWEKKVETSMNESTIRCTISYFIFKFKKKNYFNFKSYFDQNNEISSKDTYKYIIFYT